MNKVMGIEQAASEKTLAGTDQATNNTNMEDLDQQVKSIMVVSENADPYSKNSGRARICKVCGKEGGVADIMNHIEAHHITGISIRCGFCGQIFKTRKNLRAHKYRQHGTQ